MPELPEVETIRRGLAALLPGRKVISLSADTPKSFPNSAQDVENFLIGSTILDVRRRAKVLMIDLSSGYTLVVHLKMTGQLVFIGTSNGRETARFGAGHPSDSLVNRLPDRSTRVILRLDDATLFFNDQRKFGWMRLLPSLEVPNIDFMRKVGPEPLEADFTLADFKERFRRRPRSTIKAALLDQTVIAGVGNIYADESLWGARVHPARPVASIRPAEWRRLYLSLREVMNLAIEKGGSTDRNYVDAEGRKGSYLDFARVFRREGQACPRCGHVILKTRVASRGTHYCPHCQRL